MELERNQGVLQKNISIRADLAVVVGALGRIQVLEHGLIRHRTGLQEQTRRSHLTFQGRQQPGCRPLVSLDLGAASTQRESIIRCE
jgi:hypothetical protein